MSRHGRTVPVEFYHRFTRDACALADRIAGGRIISVLEGTSKPRYIQREHSLTTLGRWIQ
jgi:acetoin utilization deacetylase AcuC-like enzyme